jgi:hypothetical protein
VRKNGANATRSAILRTAISPDIWRDRVTVQRPHIRGLDLARSATRSNQWANEITGMSIVGVDDAQIDDVQMN